MPRSLPTTFAATYKSTVAPDDVDHEKPTELGTIACVWDMSSQTVLYVPLERGISYHQFIQSEGKSILIRKVEPAFCSRWSRTDVVEPDDDGVTKVYLLCGEDCETAKLLTKTPNAVVTVRYPDAVDDTEDPPVLEYGAGSTNKDVRGCKSSLRDCQNRITPWEGRERKK